MPNISENKIQSAVQIKRTDSDNEKGIFWNKVFWYKYFMNKKKTQKY